MAAVDDVASVPASAFVGPPKRRRSLLDDLTDELLALVQADGYVEGSRLPSTRALAQRAAVATPTMREALRRLEVVGVVSIRHGSGVFVRDRFPPSMMANPVRRMNIWSVLDVLDARIVLEPELTDRASRRRTALDVDRLERALQEAGAALRQPDDERLAAATMSFHVGIAAAAGNKVLAESVCAITELYAEHQLVIGRIFDDRERDHREHQELLVAIRARQPAQARRLMSSHLREVYNVVENKLRMDHSGSRMTPDPITGN